jgi:hypothetical protein
VSDDGGIGTVSKSLKGTDPGWPHFVGGVYMNLNLEIFRKAKKTLCSVVQRSVVVEGQRVYSEVWIGSSSLDDFWLNLGKALSSDCKRTMRLTTPAKI